MSVKPKDMTLVFRATVTASKQEFQESLERRKFITPGEDFQKYLEVLEIRDLQDEFEVESSFEEVA